MDDLAYKNWAEIAMSRFDDLPAELRALVRKYNSMPMPGETVDQYQLAMDSCYPEGVI